MNNKINNIMKYTRICLNCGKIIEYKSYTAWHNANKINSDCRSCSAKARTKRVANLAILLDDNLESYYWMGFLLADGSFNEGKLTFSLKKSDSRHLKKFGDFINYTGTYGTSEVCETITCKDIDVVSNLCKKFDIRKNKTYNPPVTLLKFNTQQNLAILAGFIDGDGCIKQQTNRKDFYLTIKCHSSWEHILKEFNLLICDNNYTKINNQGYAVLTITNTKYLQNLKEKILDLNIPIMCRKWDVIDMNFISKYTKAEELRNKAINLYKQGYQNKDISRICNTSKSNITKIIKNYKLNNEHNT